MKRLVLLLFLFCTIALGHTYQSVSMAPNTLKGWVVASDTWGYVLHTPDCGLTWINQSFLPYGNRHFFDVFFLNEQKGWIGTDQAFLYYTKNGGISWNNQTMGLSAFAYRIFFIDDSCGWVACSNAIIGRTINGNDTFYINLWDIWQQICLPYTIFHYDTVDIWGISFIDRQKGWICAGRYLRDIYPTDTF